MLAPQRHERILEFLRRDGSVRVSEIATALGVSEMTARRDLDVLEREGLAEKVHGGALATTDNSANEPGFEAKSARQLGEKEQIAKTAVRKVQPGMAVALSAGTTTWALAHQLTAIDDLTIVTNSPSIAGVFYADTSPNRTVVLTGGIRTPSDALVGPIATAAIASLHVDLAFMGVHGMDSSGFSTPNLAEAEANQALIRSARKLVVLADYTKWGTRGLATIAPLSAAAAVITDRQLPGDAMQAFDSLETTELVIADPRIEDERTSESSQQ